MVNSFRSEGGGTYFSAQFGGGQTKIDQWCFWSVTFLDVKSYSCKTLNLLTKLSTRDVIRHQKGWGMF